MNSPHSSRLAGLFLLLGFSGGVRAAAPVADLSYVLRPNDSISVNVYDEPDLSGTFRILKTGQVSLKFLDLVSVDGLSVVEAQKKIANLYKEKEYLIDPKVTITVEGYAAEYVSVLGSVRSPGQVSIPVSGQIDLATAMASVGGLAEDADRNSIQLVRGSGTVGTYSIDAITTGTAGRTPLKSGDRILVNKSRYIGKTITVLGPVGRPGPIAFPLDGKLDLVKAIAFAGGMTDMANPRKVEINRRGTILKVDFKAISQRGDRIYPILPEDVITVAERIF